MVKRPSIRLLSTWILAAALLSAVAAEALAAAGPRTWGRVSVKVSAPAPKPLPRAFNGEPDNPNNLPTATPSKDMLPPGSQLPLALQIRLGLGVLLSNLPHP